MPPMRAAETAPDQATKPLGAFPIAEQPGTGVYRCTKCDDFEVTVTGPEDQLPPCANCGSAPDVLYMPMDENARVSHGVPNRDDQPPQPR